MVGILYKIYKDSVGDVGRKVGKKSDGEAARIPRVAFGDVAGIDHAKERVMEVVDFIKNPTKYKRMGARLNKGILLVGPPGTGKTLLARCIASKRRYHFSIAVAPTLLKFLLVEEPVEYALCGRRPRKLGQAYYL